MFSDELSVSVPGLSTTSSKYAGECNMSFPYLVFWKAAFSDVTEGGNETEDHMHQSRA